MMPLFYLRVHNILQVCMIARMTVCISISDRTCANISSQLHARSSQLLLPASVECNTPPTQLGLHSSVSETSTGRVRWTVDRYHVFDTTFRYILDCMYDRRWCSPDPQTALHLSDRSNVSADLYWQRRRWWC